MGRAWLVGVWLGSIGAVACEDLHPPERELPPAVEAQPEPLVVFVTELAYSGRIGIENADAECNRAAKDAALAGSYHAWLSTKLEDAKTHVRALETERAYVLPRPDRPLVAENGRALLGGGLDHAIDRAADGRPLNTMFSRVWTATDTAGAFAGPACGNNEWR